MSNEVQFDDDEWKVAQAQSQRLTNRQATQSSFQGWLIRHGLAKSDKSAQAILLCFVAFNIIVTIILLRMVL